MDTLPNVFSTKSSSCKDPAKITGKWESLGGRK